MESILCILYFSSKFGKSGVQRFKRCANRSWNEEVMAVWRQSRKVVRKFRSCEIHLRKFRKVFCSCETTCKHTCATSQVEIPSSQLRTTLWNHLQAANQGAKSSPSYEIISKLWMKLRNHLQVAKSTFSCEMDNSTCKIHLCNLRYLQLTQLDFFSRYFV